MSLKHQRKHTKRTQEVRSMVAMRQGFVMTLGPRVGNGNMCVRSYEPSCRFFFLVESWMFVYLGTSHHVLIFVTLIFSIGISIVIAFYDKDSHLHRGGGWQFR